MNKYTTDGTLLFYTAYISKVTQLNQSLTLKLLRTPNHIKHYIQITILSTKPYLLIHPTKFGKKFISEKAQILAF